MGCDIHATIEKKFTKLSWYSLATDFDIDRNYELFGYLAGIRGKKLIGSETVDIEPIIQVRGLPSDVSDEFKKQINKMRGDAHTPSWILFSEMNALPEKFKQEPFYITMEAFAKKYGEDDVRLVFFFDN